MEITHVLTIFWCIKGAATCIILIIACTIDTIGLPSRKKEMRRKGKKEMRRKKGKHEPSPVGSRPPTYS
jgi:hypothetical protein